MEPPVMDGFLSERAIYVDLSYFLWCSPDEAFEQIVVSLLIWDAMMLMWLQCDIKTINATIERPCM